MESDEAFPPDDKTATSEYAASIDMAAPSDVDAIPDWKAHVEKDGEQNPSDKRGTDAGVLRLSRGMHAVDRATSHLHTRTCLYRERPECRRVEKTGDALIDEVGRVLHAELMEHH